MWLLIKKTIINYQGLPVEGGEHNLNRMAVPKWSFCRASEEYSIAQTHLCPCAQESKAEALEPEAKWTRGRVLRKIRIQQRVLQLHGAISLQN